MLSNSLPRTAACTTKHYEFIAALVAQLRPGNDGAPAFRQMLIDALCAKFHLDNPKFNEGLFRRACK